MVYNKKYYEKNKERRCHKEVHNTKNKRIGNGQPLNGLSPSSDLRELKGGDTAQKMAGLTKQHFEEIAKILNTELILNVNNCVDEWQQDSIKTIFEDLSIKLSNYFKTQNPLFNENQFKKACLE